jgi:hypothetical protein
MLDAFGFLNNTNNYQIFYGGDTSGNNWQTWRKPRGSRFVYMICIGGGQGGFGGFGSNGAGGNANGGPSGAITRALFSSSVLPDILYVLPGAGSAGGAGAAGLSENPPGTASRSRVAILPGTTVTQLVCVSGAADGGSGTPETIATPAAANFLSMSNFVSLAGVANPNTTSNLPALSSSIVMSGVRGGTVAGGTGYGITGISTLRIPTIAGGATGGGRGDNGIFSIKPFYSLGGAGGGYNPAGVGGNGGNGSYGGGGGGGGVGSTTGGSGGRGGDGLVLIAWF